MAEEKKVTLKDGEVVVDQKTLASILEKQADLEKQVADNAAKSAGIEALMAEQAGPDTNGEKKLRERKNFEPAFHTVTLKKYPIAGNTDDMGIIIGWDNRGAYQKVDKSGVSPTIVDYLNVFFLGRERNADGKLQAEAVPLLELMGAAEVTCKIIEEKRSVRKEPTGEEIMIKSWDPKHGQVETGETIDGWVGFTDRTFTLQIPGIAEQVTIDEKYCNI